MQWSCWCCRLAVCLCLSGCGEEPGEPAATDEAAETASEAMPDPALLQRIEDSIAAAGDYLNAGRVEDAQTLVDWLMEHAADRWEVHELRGQIHVRNASAASRIADVATADEQMRQAHLAYERAVELNDSDADLRQSAGIVAWQADELDIARRHFQEGARLDPGNPQHPFYEAQLLITGGHFNLAAQRLRVALKMRPDEPYFLASMATVLMEQGRCDDADEHARKARDLDPGNPELRIKHATILRRCEEPQQAIDVLSGLTAEQRAQLRPTEELAAALTDLNRPMDAARAWEACFRQMHPLDPERWRAGIGAARSLLAAEEPEQAWEWYSSVEMFAPPEPAVTQLREAIQQALRERDS